MDEKTRSLAVLFDGDNVSQEAAKAVIDEASKHGYLKIRRVYGDWSAGNLAGWKKASELNAIMRIQQDRISGKNSTDGALIMDAMRMLYTEDVDGFCIVSSDGDYTRLALELREKGKYVLGMGERKTPQSLVNACHMFTHMETIAPTAGAPPGTVAADPAPTAAELTERIRKAVDELSGEDEWARLADVGNRLRALDPSFDPRTYGFEKLHLLIRSKPDKFELKDNTVGGVFSGHLIRLKPDK